MFVGHYSASFAAKAADQRIPLWLLFIAVQFVDVMWAIFVLLGIEKVRIVPGITASNPLDLYYMPYTHSLIGAVGWAVLAGLLPADDRWRHSHGSRGHGRSHVLPAFLAPFLVIPVLGGSMSLGTWQSIALVDLNIDNPDRQVRMSFLG